MKRVGYVLTLKVLLLLLISGLATTVKAQLSSDQLLTKLHDHPRNDTTRAKIYKDLASSYTYVDLDLFKSYNDSLYFLSVKLNYRKGLASAFFNYGLYHTRQKEWKEMFYFFNLADSMYISQGNEYGHTMVKESYSNYYQNEQNYEKALQLNFEALKYYQRTSNQASEARILGKIALLLMHLQRYEEADDYYKQSITIREKIGDMEGKAIALANLGSSLCEQDKLKEALPYLEECMVLSELLGLKQVIIICKANLSRIYAAIGRYQLALNYINDCIPLFSAISDTTNLANMSIYSSIAYSGLHQYEKSLEALGRGLEMVKGKKDYSQTETDIYWQYYQVYKSMGNTDKALEYFEYAELQESATRDMQLQGKISKLKEEYETERKEHENQELRRQNEIKDLQIGRRNYFIYGSVVLLVLMGVMTWLLIYSSRLKTAKIKSETEQRLLRAQMNPHFIFNALNSIHNYIHTKSIEDAGKFLTSFARLMRSILENSRQDTITLSSELQWLENYVKLQKLRFESPFTYSVEIDPELHPDLVLIPPMLIQPFVENAIEHAFSTSDEEKILRVHYLLREEYLEIRVSDNGIGFDTGEQKQKNHKSLAIRITQERIRLLNRRRSKQILFKIDSQTGKGTEVTFSIPYQTLI